MILKNKVVPIGTKYNLLKHEVQKGEEHSKIASPHFITLNRTDQEKEENLFVGILGEIGASNIFKLYYPSFPSVNFDVYCGHGDGGRDFFYRNKKINIKTSLYDPKHVRVVMGPRYKNFHLDADIYIGCELIIETYTVIYYGGISRDALLKNNILYTDRNEKGEYCWFYRRYLRELNENFEYPDDEKPIDLDLSFLD